MPMRIFLDLHMASPRRWSEHFASEVRCVSPSALAARARSTHDTTSASQSALSLSASCCRPTPTLRIEASCSTCNSPAGIPCSQRRPLPSQSAAPTCGTHVRSLTHAEHGSTHGCSTTRCCHDTFETRCQTRRAHLGLNVEERNEEALVAGSELQECHTRGAAAAELRLPLHVQPQCRASCRSHVPLHPLIARLLRHSTRHPHTSAPLSVHHHHDFQVPFPAVLAVLASVGEERQEVGAQENAVMQL